MPAEHDKMRVRFHLTRGELTRDLVHLYMHVRELHLDCEEQSSELVPP